MGLTAERVAQRLGITREAADEFSLRSHQRALAAIQAGKFEDETVAVPVSFTTPNGSKPKNQEIVFKLDEGPRADTSLEASRAEARFHAKGTVTAGNSSQIQMALPRRSSCPLSAPKAGHPASGTLRFLRDRRVQAGRNGPGPVYAIPKALKLAGLKLSDIDVIELNEAFAAQALAVIKEAGLDPSV